MTKAQARGTNVGKPFMYFTLIQAESDVGDGYRAVDEVSFNGCLAVSIVERVETARLHPEVRQFVTLEFASGQQNVGVQSTFREGNAALSFVIAHCKGDDIMIGAKAG